MSREVMYATREHLDPVARPTQPPREVSEVPQLPRANAPTPTPSQAPTNFGQAVEIFRQNYVLYKTSGRAEYKTAYENAESWIQQYLSSMQNTITDGKQQITSFVDRNVNSGTELGQLSQKMKMIKTEGPAAQDKYATIKRIQSEEVVDYTDLYVKGGIAAALVGIAVVVSLF